MKPLELSVAVHAALLCRIGEITRSFKLEIVTDMGIAHYVEYPYYCDPIG